MSSFYTVGAADSTPLSIRSVLRDGDDVHCAQRNSGPVCDV